MLFRRKKAHDEQNDSARLITESTPFAVIEAFRALYVNVLYLPIEDKCKKIAITSAFPGEGKTYTSINLSITTAQNSDSKKVLLIDLDMRKSSICKLFANRIKDGNVNQGLTEYLTGITDEPNILETDIPNLYILFAGHSCINPAGLILSKRFEALLKECEEKFDFIFIDTPPVTVVSDAALLVGRVNGFLISTRADFSTTSALSTAVDTLSNVGAQIFGIVYTDEKMKKAKGYGKYGSYSGYDK